MPERIGGFLTESNADYIVYGHHPRAEGCRIVRGRCPSPDPRTASAVRTPYFEALRWRHGARGSLTN